MNLSPKGNELIGLYQRMAGKGYTTTDGQKVHKVFSDFESRPYRRIIKEIFLKHGVKSVLDYGCGGSLWTDPQFDPSSGKSAIDFYGLEQALRYEPARKIDDRSDSVVDCVISFDVLEHVFISDIPTVLRDIFRIAKKLIILNIACYPAAATLPNGENAHITVRAPLWWKGQVDSIATEWPHIQVYLGCSKRYGEIGFFPEYSGQKWQNSTKFVIET